MSRRKKEFLSIAPGNKTGVLVVNGDINFALRQFKRIVKKSGTLFEHKNRTHYTKPSTKRRKKRLSAIFSQRLESKRSR
tara:strand:+ start:166 stop:402 length:237 start_codon:yes stop_codon:yes gene_type:complete